MRYPLGAKSSSPQTGPSCSRKESAMEGELWPEVYRILHEESNQRPRPKHPQFSAPPILEVYFWAVLHDRPTHWACRRENWPVRDRWQGLPSGKLAGAGPMAGIAV